MNTTKDRKLRKEQKNVHRHQQEKKEEGRLLHFQKIRKRGQNIVKLTTSFHTLGKREMNILIAQKFEQGETKVLERKKGRLEDFLAENVSYVEQTNG